MANTLEVRPTEKNEIELKGADADVSLSENNIQDGQTESRVQDKSKMNLTGMSEDLLNDSVGSFNDYKLKNDQS